MEILSGANQPKDIVSKEYVDGQINNHVHDATDIPCESKTLKLGSKEYKISDNLQKALENLLDYVYMNASGVLDLQTNLKSVSDTVSKIPSYKGGTGISVAGDTIGHSNNTLPGMVGTGEILTPDFGDTVYTTWFSYDAQGHVTQSGTGGFVIPTVQTDDSLSNTSTNPLQNKTVKAKFDAVDSQISSLSTDNGNLWAKVKTKADNTAEGATALLGNLSESTTAPGDEDEVIIKNLNQYTRRPLTKLFDWIKANLAKVATSGSYNDLTNKPDIPTVDSSFSEDGTNAVAGNVILSALNSKANKTELQALSNQVSNKADVNHTHAYLPLAGGKLSSNSFGTQLKIERQSVDAATVGFMNSNGVLGYVGMTGTANSGLKWWKANASQVVVLDEDNYKTYVTPTNIGASASNHNHDSAYAAKNHTHNYAGSSTAGGSATSAVALTSKSIGTDVVPVYFDANGKPVVCKYTLGDASTKTIKTATAISNTGWANLTTGQKYIPDMAFISYWNGAINDQGNSNLKYCNKGAFGTAATKGVDTTVKSGSANLITSGGVSTALSNKVSTTSNTIVPTWWCGTDTANTTGYYHFMTVTMAQHEDFNMTLLITNEFGSRYVGIFNTHIRCDSGTTTNAPDHMSWLVRRGWAANAIIAVVSGLTVKYYINQVVPQFSGICFKALNVSSRRGNSAKYTTVFSTSPTTGLKASATSNDNSIVSDATKWNGLTDDTMTENTTDTRLMVLNGSKVQHRQIDTLPFLSSDDLAQPVLYTSTTTTASATITNLFANYSLVWFQVVGSKTTHTHILPLAYLKSKGSLTFKDSGTPINILYVSDTQIRWFEYQGQGAETYTSVAIVRII